jgi:isopentenyl diphosphate isomerase/L-lactate dehydrogenase-like FMN-dependent dehydrogenase
MVSRRGFPAIEGPGERKSMRFGDILSIDDLRRAAKRRLPRLLFELIESGVEAEHGLTRNRAAFERYTLLPRYLVDVARIDLRTELMGETYAAPFGVAPTGFAGLLREDADRMLAEASAEAGLPFILSGASVAAPEEIGPIGDGKAWYHFYPAKDPSITRDQMKRAWDSGFRTLIYTVDNPVYPKRERDTRNGFGKPIAKMPLGIVLEALLHPRWLISYLRAGGMPVMRSWAKYAPAGAGGLEVATFFRSQSPSIQTWRDLDGLRAAWPGKFLLKGVQHPDDATQAVKAGIDGVIVSNHGGKSFDPLPSPLSTLPAIKRAVQGAVPVMLDSGIRRGSDIVIAKCLGADFVFVGRATLYGTVAFGKAGAAKAIDILRQEIWLSLALIGCPEFAKLSGDFLARE